MRDKIVEEALSWLRTPYHSGARIKRVGTDCGMLLLEVYGELELIPKFIVEPYPLDWALHQNDNRYMDYVVKYFEPTDNPQKGDIALYKFGRAISHGGIIIDNKLNIVHSLNQVGVVIAHYKEGALGSRFVGFYTLKELDGFPI